jgi:hypothetical protein
MAILRSFIAKQAMPFGDHLFLKKRWQFHAILLQKNDAIWQSFIAEKAMAIWLCFIA